jgi:glycosyltransferase involved in cell wall biosynthesis
MKNHKSKIHIVQLVDGFRLGGAETKLLELIKNLDQKRYKITVCSLLDIGSLKDDFELLGINVKVFNRKNRFDVTLIPKLIRFLRKERVHILQSTLFYADALGPISARLAGVPVVVSWETCSHHHLFFNPVHRGLAYRLAMKFVDKVVVVSNDVRKSIESIRKVDPLRIKTIHYGVDLKRFENISQSLNKKKREIGLNSEYPIIGIVARFDEIKGHRYFIEAFNEIVLKYPKSKCLLIGDGECRANLEIQCQDSELTKNVLFLGFRNDVVELLTILDIFVLPSISEGLPNAILEAMACTVPVVATNVGGIPEIITNNVTGKLVQPRNSKDLANAVLQLLENNKKMRKIAENGRNFIKNEFSLNKQVQQFEALYEYLIKEKIH